MAATGKVRTAAAQTADKVQHTSPRDLAVEARDQVRGNQIPLPLVIAGVTALVGLILIVRGRRR